MKLLLDENLSDRIVYKIIDLYPGSEHVKTLSLRFTWLYPLLANQFGQLNHQILKLRLGENSAIATFPP